MKRAVASVIIIIMALIPFQGWAEPLDFVGGVHNEYEYSEVVFLTGEPIKFVGEYKVTINEKEDEKKIKYDFRLTPEDKEIEGKFSRRLTLITKYDKRNDKGQTIAYTEVDDNYSETITIGDEKFVLEDFQFSKSNVIDNRPASDFYSGNLKGRKYYKYYRDNDEQGKIILDISGGDVGYQNFWGGTQTQLINYVIDFDGILLEGDEDDELEEEEVEWQGTVNIQTSDSTSKSLKYSENEANFSSFDGGHLRITNREVVSKYNYDLPQWRDGVPRRGRREKETITLSKKMNPKVERLIIPKFKDLGGHWAQEYIEKLYSLDVFEGSVTFFLPDSPMTRLEFTKGIIQACDIRPSVENDRGRVERRRNREPEIAYFNDVDVNHESYDKVKQAVEKGLIKGTNDNNFDPDEPLTRAQAITILIRALGFETKAPTPGYYTSFDDDGEIPYWAKDFIYVAREVGLIYGDQSNRINPNGIMTRAEASAMLVRFLEFLQRDLQRDYRENIVNFM
ncbi:MAG: S-layer homology domain-containing protein [Clostridia bacterium]|nr:S-layer homology domain-containing protein [Clostridia bacterium]